MPTVNDSTKPFLAHPWTAALLANPNTTVVVPHNRVPKSSTEDSLFALSLKSPTTFSSCIALYTTPSSSAASSSSSSLSEVTTLLHVGDGVNGHAEIMHGGIVAAILDEGMGILQTINHERGLVAKGEKAERGIGGFTVELVVRYKRPVRTPGVLSCVARTVRREGRKEWVRAEIRQCEGGEEVVCAEGEALFVEPKVREVKM